MSADFIDKTELPAVDTDSRMPADEKMPVEESIPLEEPYSFDEFNERPSPRPESRERHRDLKKLFLKPVAALVLVGALITASLGIDPLSSAADITPAADTAQAEETADGEERGPEADEEPAAEDGEQDAEPADTDEQGETDAPDEEDEEDVFPTLTNLDPDFAGDYAWSEEGSEEYVRFIPEGGSYLYLQKGSAWDVYDPYGQEVGRMADIAYDKSTNVLRLKNLNAEALDVNLMGNGFTIELVGDSHIGTVSVWGAMYAGSVTFIGDGSLTVDNGIYLNCEGSESCMIVKKGVTLDISGEPAIVIGDTTLDGGIYLSKSLKLTGGEVVQVADEDAEYEGRRLYTYTVMNAGGEPATHVSIEPVK